MDTTRSEGVCDNLGRVTRAPKGSAVFEVVSEQAYSGVVIDRMVAKGTNIASGLVQYEVDGVPAKLTYGPKDLQARSTASLLLILTSDTIVFMPAAGLYLPMAVANHQCRNMCAIIASHSTFST